MGEAPAVLAVSGPRPSDASRVPTAPMAAVSTRVASDSERLARAARDNFQFIWRCLRRFGVQPEHAVDDAVQRVFEIAATRAALVLPGHERAFLFKTAVLVAKERRRLQRSPREVPDTDAISSAIDPINPEQLLEQRRWRDVLDVLLESMPSEQREVFVLYELEGLAGHEIASMLDIPAGTVASRLRRARATFHRNAQRVRARLEASGEKP